MEEEWRVIPSIPLYEASSLGRIRSTYRRGRMTPDRILKPTPDRKGYLKVSPSMKCIKYTAPVHTLVAEAFLGPCPLGHCVHHRNHKKQDNVPENLEYVCHCEHTSREKRGEKAHFAKLNKFQVIEIRWLYRLNFRLRDISKMTNVHAGTIRSIVIRKSWKHI